MLRLSILLAVAALLTGCGNIVYSETPMFSKADRSGAPAFRPGLWAMAEPACQFDSTQPLAAWPTCANGTLMTKHGPADDPLKDPRGYLIAAGDPLILQQGGKDEPEYFYTAIKPVAFDGRRRITTVEIWTVQCGPPPPGEETNVSNRHLTQQLFPGLEAKGDNCLVRDRGVLRAAARASRAWTPQMITARWMRDGRS